MNCTAHRPPQRPSPGGCRSPCSWRSRRPPPRGAAPPPPRDHWMQRSGGGSGCTAPHTGPLSSAHGARTGSSLTQPRSSTRWGQCSKTSLTRSRSPSLAASWMSTSTGSALKGRKGREMGRSGERRATGGQNLHPSGEGPTGGATGVRCGSGTSQGVLGSGRCRIYCECRRWCGPCREGGEGCARGRAGPRVARGGRGLCVRVVCATKGAESAGKVPWQPPSALPPAQQPQSVRARARRVYICTCRPG